MDTPLAPAIVTTEPSHREVLPVEPPAVEPPMSSPSATKKRASGLGSLLGLAAFGAVSLAAAAIGGYVNAKPKNKLWYRMIRKSSWTPPDRVFGIVWPVLYGLGAYSAWRVAKTAPSEERTEALAWWGVQIVANAVWTPLFFGAHRPRWAMADLVFNTVALGRYAQVARRLDPVAAALVLPNLGWLGFAAKLNSDVVVKNASIRGRA